MLRSVEVVYCQVEEGVVVCFLHHSLFHPPVGVLEIPPHLDELKAVKEFVEKMAKDAGLAIEADPHHEGVFHIFHS